LRCIQLFFDGEHYNRGSSRSFTEAPCGGALWDIMPVVLIAGFVGLPFKTQLHL
jgi:hypothetical protein